MGEFLQVCPKRLCISTVGKRTDLFARDPFKVPITDFFGSVRNVELSQRTENFSKVIESSSSEAEEGEKSPKISSEKSDTKMYSYPPLLPILQTLE